MLATMQHLLPKQLPDFKQASLLVVGDVMLDRYWFGDTQRVSPEAPVPIVNVNHVNNRPGGAANVALNIKALGAQALLFGVTGQDEPARCLTELLTAAEINHYLHAASNHPTIIKLRIISRHQQLIRADFEQPLSCLTQTPLMDHYQQSLKNTKLLILSDYKKGSLNQPQALIKLAKAANTPILVDPKGNDFSIYAHSDIITPNLKEFEAIVGSCHDEASLIEKGFNLLTQNKIKSLLITRGEQGMTLLHQNEVYHFSACAREVLDVTGAGDTVISVLGASLAAGLDLPQATALANLAASISVAKLGAATVSQPELHALLNQHTQHRTGVVTEEQLFTLVQEAKALGKRIVFTNGCFDILHAGHVSCLQLAKALGDYLIVAVNHDASIKRLKGESRPINHLEHRMTVLAGLGVVDWVVPFADDTPERLLHLLQPDFLVKGGEYQPHQVVGADIVKAYGGEVRIVGEKISSSSTIINKIRETSI